MFFVQHRFGEDMAGTRREENLDEGNNNGLEGVVEILERVHKDKDKKEDKHKDKNKDIYKEKKRVKTNTNTKTKTESFEDPPSQVYTDKDQPGASPSLDVSLRCH